MMMREAVAWTYLVQTNEREQGLGRGIDQRDVELFHQQRLKQHPQELPRGAREGL
jgi:hypothetical protein